LKRLLFHLKANATVEVLFGKLTGSRQFMKVYHLYASSLEKLVSEVQTRVLFAKYAFFLHSFRSRMYEVSREKN